MAMKLATKTKKKSGRGFAGMSLDKPESRCSGLASPGLSPLRLPPALAMGDGVPRRLAAAPSRHPDCLRPRGDWEKAPDLAASSGAEFVQGSRRLGQVQRDLACTDRNDACAGPAGEPADRRRCRRGP